MTTGPPEPASDSSPPGIALLGAARVRSLLDGAGLAPTKSLGQNFLVDPNTARRIAEASGAGAGDHVLEVGPGLGSLTLALVERGARVTAVEIDTTLTPVLRAVVEDAGAADTVTVVEGDARTVDLRFTDPTQPGEVAPGSGDRAAGSGDGAAGSGDGAPSWRLAANLPYNVGTAILLRVLADAPGISGGVVLVQREVADRLTAVPRNRLWGIPSVKARWWITPRAAGRVPPTVFHPRPKVDSALVTFERHPPPGDDALRDRTFALVDAGFGQRRKMLRRSLASLDVTATDLDAADVDPTARAEELDLDDWVRLARAT